MLVDKRLKVMEKIIKKKKSKIEKKSSLVLGRDWQGVEAFFAGLVKQVGEEGGGWDLDERFVVSAIIFEVKMPDGK